MFVGAFLIGIGLHTNLIHLPFARAIDASFPEALSTDRGFVGAVHTVSVAKVMKNTGQSIVNGIPTTQFQVQIIKNIKGTLPERVVLQQSGGYENGVLITMEEQPLLKAGSTYLLSTRTDGKGMYLVSAYTRGTILLSADQKLTTTQLLAISTANKDVIALRNAYATELPFDIDVQNTATFNSFIKTVTIPSTPISPQTW